MTSSKTIDAETLKKNCMHFARSHFMAVDILRKANGKDDYKKIAKNVRLHETTVSGLLKFAEKLGLCTWNKGVYRKIPGILRYMPRVSVKNKSVNSVSQLIERISQRTKRFSDPKQATFEVKFRDNPDKMAKSYLWLYVTENTLRDLIRRVLGGEQDWWDKKVHPGIKKEVETAKGRYPYDGAKRRDELEYTHLGQLKEIVTSKNNWNLFGPFLNEKDKNTFQALVDKAIPSRNSIGHCTQLSADDFRFVEVRFRDILKMIKN